MTHPHQPVLRFEFERVFGFVQQCEAGRFATTELSTETVDHNEVFVGLVHRGELVTEFVFAHVWSLRVKDVDDHLLALYES